MSCIYKLSTSLYFKKRNQMITSTSTAFKIENSILIMCHTCTKVYISKIKL